MSKKNSVKPVVGMLGTAFAVSLAFSPVTNAESNPFSLNDLSTGYQVAEGKCGEGKCGEKKAEAKCGEGKCGAKGVDMQGNVVELGNFTYGGDNMATYSGGKIATGAKDPAVCGTFSPAKCSVGHLK